MLHQYVSATATARPQKVAHHRIDETFPAIERTEQVRNHILPDAHLRTLVEKGGHAAAGKLCEEKNSAFDLEPIQTPTQLTGGVTACVVATIRSFFPLFAIAK